MLRVDCLLSAFEHAALQHRLCPDGNRGAESESYERQPQVHASQLPERSDRKESGDREQEPATEAE